MNRPRVTVERGRFGPAESTILVGRELSKRQSRVFVANELFDFSIHSRSGDGELPPRHSFSLVGLTVAPGHSSFPSHLPPPALLLSVTPALTVTIPASTKSRSRTTLSMARSAYPRPVTECSKLRNHARWSMTRCATLPYRSR